MQVHTQNTEKVYLVEMMILIEDERHFLMNTARSEALCALGVTAAGYSPLSCGSNFSQAVSEIDYQRLERSAGRPLT